MYVHVHDANTHMLGFTERMHGVKACMHDAKALMHGSMESMHGVKACMQGAKALMHGVKAYMYYAKVFVEGYGSKEPRYSPCMVVHHVCKALWSLCMV